jgi:hypothetical protein
VVKAKRVEALKAARTARMAKVADRRKERAEWEATKAKSEVHHDPEADAIRAKRVEALKKARAAMALKRASQFQVDMARRLTDLAVKAAHLDILAETGARG